MTNRLKESAALTGSGAKRRIRLISEGQGSSGYYPGEVLERDGAAAWPAGTQLFFDHLTESDGYERGGSHSIKDLVGVTLTDAVYEEDTRALFAEAKFFPNASDFVEHASEFIGLSVEANGTKVDEIIESIHPSPLNAIAIVPRAGRDGKILELVESYREVQSGKISESSNSDTVKEHKPMDEKDITALAEKLAAALAPSFTALTEALKPVTPVAPVEDEKTEAPVVADVAEAIVVAFPTSEASRKRVYEALTTNPDVAKAIEDEKALVASVAESLKETYEADGFTIRESSRNDDDYRVNGWAN